MLKGSTSAKHGFWADDNVSAGFGNFAAAREILRGPFSPSHVDRPSPAAAPTTPTAAEEFSFINGLKPNDTITAKSYWGSTGRTAFKWGESTAGTGATISYFFDPASDLSAREQSTFLKAFAMWSSVADVTFVEASSSLTANVLLRRGEDGGAYTSFSSTSGSGATLGMVAGQALISIDSSVGGFELSGSFDRYGGYGLSSVIHEVGHLLGLGHGGAYNGNVDEATDQYSAYDDRMYTIMSYIFWGLEDAKFLDQNPNQGTDWGITDDGIRRQAPHTIQQLDILAIQQLYGAATTTPFDGGQIYGFHSNIAGPLHDFYDFTRNTDPVVTLYNQGTGNTLDLSGYRDDQRIDLRPGEFSDVGGHINNLSIAAGTLIDTAIGGRGNDEIHGNDVRAILIGNGGNDSLYGGRGKDVLQGDGGSDSLSGYAGQDDLTGGVGADSFWFYKTGDSSRNIRRSDTITDFNHADGDKIELSAIDAVKGRGNDAFHFVGNAAFSGVAGELRFQVSHGDTLVSGDVNGDGKADFTIRLEGVTTIAEADFVM